MRSTQKTPFKTARRSLPWSSASVFAARRFGNEVVQSLPLFVGKVPHVCTCHQIGSQNKSGAEHAQGRAVRRGCIIKESYKMARSTSL